MTDKRTLSDIISDLMSIVFYTDEVGGEIDENTIGKLDNLDVELSDKVNSILWVIENYISLADVTNQRGISLIEQSKTIIKRMESLKLYLKKCLENAGIKKMATLDFPSVSIQRNPPSVVITDENSIMSDDRWLNYPEQPPPKINKKAVLEALKKGEIIDGAEMRQAERLVWK